MSLKNPKTLWKISNLKCLSYNFKNALFFLEFFKSYKIE